MFEAIVLFCVMNGEVISKECLEAHDTRGPYIYINDCENRVIEMIGNISRIHPYKQFHYSYKCSVTVKGTPT